MNAHPVPALQPSKLPDDDVPAYDAREMTGDGVQARIILDDQMYWLRITRAGKLILTK
ncbi:MAG: hemin uptake protein HemP [Pseudomonadota bacterium]